MGLTDQERGLSPDLTSRLTDGLEQTGFGALN